MWLSKSSFYNLLILGQVGSMLDPETAAVVVCVASQSTHFTLRLQMKIVRQHVMILFSNFV